MNHETRTYDSLDFAVEKSIRYHQRRLAHYTRLQKLVALGIIVAGSGAFVQFFGRPQWFGLAAAALGALDFVAGFSLRAREHAVLQKRFTDLAGEMRATAKPTDDQLRHWQRRRLDIETEEPPVHYALEAWCDNEVCRALGWVNEGLIPLTRWQRLMMNWFTFSRTEFPDRTAVKKAEGHQKKDDPKKGAAVPAG